MRKGFAQAAIALAIAAVPGIVSAAEVTVLNDSCVTFNTASLCDADIRPTGTGIFNPFLKTNPGGGLDPSSGWNTDANKQTWTQPNDGDDPWTSALLASSLGSTGGFVIFTVDIDQQGQPGDPSSLLSLSHFELYSCPTATYTSLSGCTSFFNLFGGTVTYDASDRPVITTANWANFDYRLHTGSGSGDIDILIPVGVFPTTGFVALLDGWGTPGTYADNDGPQEWRVTLGTQTCPDGTTPGENGECDVIVPEPATLLLFGLAALGRARRLRRHLPKH